MAKPAKQAISALLNTHQAEVLQAWLQRLKAEGALQSGRIREGELQAQCSEFLTRLRDALERRRIERRRPRVCRRARAARRDVRLARDAGLQPARDRDVRVFAEAAAVRRVSAPRRSRRGGQRWRPTGRSACCSTSSACSPPRPTRRPRGADRAPAAGDRRAVDAGHQAVGRHSRVAADRHAGQPAHAGGDGEPAGDDRAAERRDRDHRHHRRADRRHADRAASAEDGRGRAG